MTSKPLGLKVDLHLSKKTFCAQWWKTMHRARKPCRAFACTRDSGLSFHSPLGSPSVPMTRTPISAPWRATVSRTSTIQLLSTRPARRSSARPMTELHPLSLAQSVPTRGLRAPLRSSTASAAFVSWRWSVKAYQEISPSTVHIRPVTRHPPVETLRHLQ